MNYYIIKDNIQQGPFSEEDMENLYFSKRLSAVTPAWYEGAENWISFSETPIYEILKKNYRKSLFLLKLPWVLCPYIGLLIFCLILISGWKEIFHTIKGFKQSDCKKYDIGLIICGLYPIIFSPVLLLYFIPSTTSLYVISILYYVFWIGIVNYSGPGKSIIAVYKKVFSAYKKARVLLKKQ